MYQSTCWFAIYVLRSMNSVQSWCTCRSFVDVCTCAGSSTYVWYHTVSVRMNVVVLLWTDSVNRNETVNALHYSFQSTNCGLSSTLFSEKLVSQTVRYLVTAGIGPLMSLSYFPSPSLQVSIYAEHFGSQVVAVDASQKGGKPEKFCTRYIILCSLLCDFYAPTGISPDPQCKICGKSMIWNHLPPNARFLQRMKI
jgi:hypothetical protein